MSKVTNSRDDKFTHFHEESSTTILQFYKIVPNKTKRNEFAIIKCENTKSTVANLLSSKHVKRHCRLVWQQPYWNLSPDMSIT